MQTVPLNPASSPSLCKPAPRALFRVVGFSACARHCRPASRAVSSAYARSRSDCAGHWVSVDAQEDCRESECNVIFIKILSMQIDHRSISGDAGSDAKS